jgi:phosphatidylserine synthase
MFERVFKRNWVSPLVAVAFVAVGVSGVLMFFHIRVPGMRYMHEWMGVVLAVAGAVHVLLNWRPFTIHFRSRAAVLAVIAAIVISGGLVFWGAKHNRRQGPPPRVETSQPAAAAEAPGRN